MTTLNNCFQFYYPEMTVKIIRKIYGCLAHKLFAPKENINLYLKKLLGHCSVNPSFSYSQIEIVD
jgi:hypothetical protein